MASTVSDRERVVAEHAALGKSNKLIAYELGIAESTVATHLSAVRRKVGARSRVELIGNGVSLGLHDLTPAEHAVAIDVLAGLSNAEVARKRGRSRRTIANQLAAIYRKLGIHSRVELAVVGSCRR